jgi:hypothetical protein
MSRRDPFSASGAPAKELLLGVKDVRANVGPWALIGIDWCIDAQYRVNAAGGAGWGRLYRRGLFYAQKVSKLISASNTSQKDKKASMEP